MIFGVGEDAAAVKATLDKANTRGTSVVGFYAPYADQPIDSSIPSHRVLPSSRSICEITGQHNVSEIVIAVRERRGGSLPLAELLNCKLKGIKVTDLSTFFERHRSRVQIDLLRESWFIFGDGFRQGRVRMSGSAAGFSTCSSFAACAPMPKKTASHSGHRPATRGSPRSGVSCASRASMNCRSCSMF
jgi:hypothetical protein